MQNIDKTNSKFEKMELTCNYYSMLQPKAEGILPKVVVGFEHNGATIYWSRNLKTAAFCKSEDESLSDAEAVQVAKEANSNALKGLEALGFDKSNPKEFNPIGQKGYCAVEEDNGVTRVAFINRVFTHAKMDAMSAAELLGEIL